MNSNTITPLTWSQRASAICVGLVVVAVFSLLIGGCAQDNDQKVKTDNIQSTPTPVSSDPTTEQAAATQGSTINVWLLNTTADHKLPTPSSVTLGEAMYAAHANGAASNGTGNGVTDAKAGYVIAGTTFNITTGGTTPSLTGSSTGSATGAPNVGLTNNPNATQNPELRARGEVSAAMPVGVAMPGGMVDQQATATGRGTTTGTTKESANELRWQKIEAAADKIEKLMPLLTQLFPANAVMPPVVAQTNQAVPANLVPVVPVTP